MRTESQMAEIEAWADELTSGKWKQGMERLCSMIPADAPPRFTHDDVLAAAGEYTGPDERRYCCLGVKVAITPGAKFDPEDNARYGESSDGVLLPWDLALRISITNEGELLTPMGVSMVDRDGLAMSLVTLNDEGVPFPQIADVIRYNRGALLREAA